MKLALDGAPFPEFLVQEVSGRSWGTCLPKFPGDVDAAGLRTTD